MPKQELGQEVVALYNHLKDKRAVWENLWQLVADFMRGSNNEFVVQQTQGQRLEYEMRSGDGVFAAQTLSSALIGMLWPSGAKSFQIVGTDKIKETKPHIEYYQAVTQALQAAMDDPGAGLSVSLAEYMQDQVSFGTSGIGVFEGVDTALSFQPWGTAQLFIDEGLDGKPELMLRHMKWRMNRVLEEFGEDNISDKLKGALDDPARMFDEIEILHLVKRRERRDVTRKDNKNFPWMSVYVEKDTDHVLRESGFKDKPVFVGRLIKNTNEVYGRSNGIMALSDIMEQDFLLERFSVNADKLGDPPLVLTDPGALGGTTIDTSARAVNILDQAGRERNNIDPLRPLFTVGDMSVPLARIDRLEERIAKHFFLDIILDMGAAVSITATEAAIRDRKNSAALGSLFVRQVAEMFDPLITRCFNVMLDKGLLGVVAGSVEEAAIRAQGQEPIIIPQEIAELMASGEDFYKIKYFTPAARMMQAQKAEALQQFTGFSQVLAGANPEVLDGFDSDEALRVAAETSGLTELLQGEDEVEAVRQARAQAAQQAAQQQQVAQQAETLKVVGESGLG